MEKNTSKKGRNSAKTASVAPMTKKLTKEMREVNMDVLGAKGTKTTADCKQCFNPWSLSIYIYWFIILFFISATFYILGRSHGMINQVQSMSNGVSEETLMQASDYYERGKTNLLAKNIADAISDLTAAIETGTANVDAYILRGEAYMQSGDYAAALNDFNMAIEKDTGNAVAYYDRALIYTRMENYEAALADVNAALAAQTVSPSEILQMRDLYAKRGQLNLWLKNWEGAIADYTNSLALPDGIVSSSVYAERAEAYTALNKYSEAILDYDSAVRVISEQIAGTTTTEERERLSSNAMSYYEKSAALNLNLGNIDDARRDLESAYTIAAALNDTTSMERLQNLMIEINKTKD